MTAGVLATVGLPYIITKAALFRWPAHRAPSVLLLIASATFSVAHILTAYSVRLWARKRYRLGLLGFGYPWEVTGHISNHLHCPVLALVIRLHLDCSPGDCKVAIIESNCLVLFQIRSIGSMGSLDLTVNHVWFVYQQHRHCHMYEEEHLPVCCLVRMPPPGLVAAVILCICLPDAG